jgi:hypothetical protein
MIALIGLAAAVLAYLIIIRILERPRRRFFREHRRGRGK